MLSPRLTNCPECASIPSLLKKIDCKLAELGNNLYNNISYMLNKPIPAGDILQLITYRRILMYKSCNPSYVQEYTIPMISSRVIRLTTGCVSRCNEPEPCIEIPCDITIIPNPEKTTTTTTSSTSSTSTTSTTTTLSPTTTTTTTIKYNYNVSGCERSDYFVIGYTGNDILPVGTIVSNSTPECFYILGITTATPDVGNIINLHGIGDCSVCVNKHTTTTTSTTAAPTTTTTSSSSSTTTTTTTIACNCVTFNNTDSSVIDHLISYKDCTDNLIEDYISANDVLQVCGCCGTADSELVIITEGDACVDGLCPTTTTTTTVACTCYQEDIEILQTVLDEADGHEVTLSYTDCTGTPVLINYTIAGIYPQSCIDTLLDTTLSGTVGGVPTNFYFPVVIGPTCCTAPVTTTTTTTCNASSEHPFTYQLIAGTQGAFSSPNFITSFVDACASRECLIAGTCVEFLGFVTRFDASPAEIGMISYLEPTGCIQRPLDDGYYIFNYGGTNFVIGQIISNTIVDFPLCPTTTTTTTV